MYNSMAEAARSVACCDPQKPLSPQICARTDKVNDLMFPARSGLPHLHQIRVSQKN